MSIFHEYNRMKTQQKIENENKVLDAKKYQYDSLNERTKDIPPIVNMKDAYTKVRENKTTLNRDFCRLTSSSLNI